MSTATAEAILEKTQRRQNVPPITVNPRRMSGQSVIGIHRVSLAALLDHVDVQAFCAAYDTIDEEEAQAAIDYLKDLAEAGALGEGVNY
jgi:uncharacterized protein (DUF433 family)